MLKLGIIGTNWITDQFILAALASKEYQLTAVYSRTFEKAKAFGEKYGDVTYYTDIDKFNHSKDIEVIYIASPNSLHYIQGKAAILAGKHVIIEKPAFSTTAEMAEIYSLAEKKQVYFFEAARNLHEKNFSQVKELLPAKEEILGANFTYMKYSSRYDAVLNGEEPNIFSLKYSGGALMDLGIYLVYAAIGWFGAPKTVHYYASKIATGVDGLGTMILRYPTFDVTLNTGKIVTSFLPSEIYTKQGTILLDSVSSIDSIKVYHQANQSVTVLDTHKEENPMIEEALDFARVIQNPTDRKWHASYQEWLQITKEVHIVLEQLRSEINLVFPADQVEKF